jgi:hypothetical protein
MNPNIPQEESPSEAPVQAIPSTNIEAAPEQVAQAARKTDDFALLNQPQPLPPDAHWTANETWRVFRIMGEFVHAFERMDKVGPAIALFGSARLDESSPYYEAASTTARLLVRDKWAILSGGGPGIMEAANRGAHLEVLAMRRQAALEGRESRMRKKMRGGGCRSG